MRVVVPVLALTLAAGAAAEAPLAPPPAVIVPMQPSPLSAMPALDGRVPCRDTIHQVREARGLPRLEDAPPAQMIAAVDHRINGCSVLVMHGNTSDVRPLPTAPAEPSFQRIPAR